MNLENFELETLLNALPQNRPLYKDSGLWQVRTDDMENVYMQQTCNETFTQFIIRYIEWLQEFEKDDIEELMWNLSLSGVS
jgi:hypothetical protein